MTTTAGAAQPPTAQPMRGPNCWQCSHFGITHIPSAPYACRLMGFQSRRLPALDVLHIDGHFCHGFLAKPSSLPSDRR